ncbi:MAG TPA: hypothetical protein VE782_01420 [Myxococcaceae bacterium]|nr:hypothetical protein [Myxococcaceae bacterium]
MSDVPGTIHALLLVRSRFKMKHVIRQVQVSRQAILKHLNRMVDSGELARQGSGPGTHYVAGPGWGAPEERGAARTPDHEGFWKELMERCQNAAYLDLFAAVGPALSRRAQAKRVLDRLYRRDLIVADFHHASSVTEAFADELLVQWPSTWGARMQPINVSAQLEPVIERVLRLRDARQGRDYVLWGKGPSRD